MEKWPMCRICLVKDVRMYVVVNKNLHELYEKLTDVPFVTEDSRPMLACSFCCAKLKQCWRFHRKCLEAEELFTQMMNEDYEQYPFIYPGSLEIFNGFSTSQIEVISVVDGGQKESDAIKEELPDVSEKFRQVIDFMEEQQTERRIMENVPPRHHAESDYKYEVPLIQIKTEVVEEHESIAPVAMEPKLDSPSSTQEETTSVDKNKHENNQKISCVPKTIKKMPKRRTKLKEPVTKIHENSKKISCDSKIKRKMPKRRTKTDSVSKIQHGVCESINNTTLVASRRNSSNKNDIECEISNNDAESDDRNKNHREPVIFKCDICQHSFTKKSDFIRHTRVHTGEKPFKCDICQRSFRLKYHLSVHTRIHTGEKPFKCDICQRNFRHKSYLTSHTRIHTGEKPFKCDVCESSFHQKIHLTTHIRTHTGEKPFQCVICQRNFAKKGDLVSHIRTHTGEKPFKCDICQRGFSKKIHFVNHTRTHTEEMLQMCYMPT